jgi:two-component system nitrate/nitrite response regulator NarL
VAHHHVPVLLVDDIALVRDMLREQFEFHPRLEVVAEAGDADEALTLARQHRPDVVILDHEMPGRSGLDVLPSLRALLPTATIYLFSSAHDDLRTTAYARGADACFDKVDFEALLDDLDARFPSE